MELDDRYIKVKDHDDLVKDSAGNAVLNSNVDAFLEFKHKRNKEKEIDKKLNKLENDISSILDILASIKIEMGDKNG